jgi:acyl-CoA thioesterase-2
MIASFQDEELGFEHQIDMPADLPQPESLPSAAEALGELDHPVAKYWATQRPFDMRHVDKPVFLSPDGPRVAHQAVWLKAVGTLPDDANLHRAALAYLSDYSILEPVFRRHGLAWSTPGLKVASLDHAMWFHRFGRVDEWLLYLQESPNATGGRGLSEGRIYSRDGVLLASVAQEGMVRAPRS